MVVKEKEKPENVDICLTSSNDNIKSSSWHLNSPYSRYLTSEKNIFNNHLTMSLSKIEYVN